MRSRASSPTIASGTTTASSSRRRGRNKKAYDPRSYLGAAETAMAARVVRAATELRSAGTTMMR